MANLVHAMLANQRVNHVLELLDPRERRYVLQVTIGRMPKSSAAKDAGFKTAPKSKAVNAAIQVMHVEMARELVIDLDYINKGIVEAIHMANLQGEPATMIAGYRELGKLGGMYVEKKEISVNVKHLTEEELQELDDAELDELIERADAIELQKNERGEFTIPGTQAGDQAGDTP